MAGFKSPAYGVGEAVMNTLEKLGYAYDSSVCPNAAAPLIRWIQRIWLRYERGRAEFGRFHSAAAPSVPYHPAAGDVYSRGGRAIWEVPVSTLPLLRLPFHFSFLNVLGMGWFALARGLHALCRPRYLNFAFHAIDILDAATVPEPLRWRPGLAIPGADKLKRAAAILRWIRSRYQTHTTLGLVEKIARQRELGLGAQLQF